MMGTGTQYTKRNIFKKVSIAKKCASFGLVFLLSLYLGNINLQAAGGLGQVTGNGGVSNYTPVTLPERVGPIVTPIDKSSRLGDQVVIKATPDPVAAATVRLNCTGVGPFGGWEIDSFTAGQCQTTLGTLRPATAADFVLTEASCDPSTLDSHFEVKDYCLFDASGTPLTSPMSPGITGDTGDDMFRIASGASGFIEHKGHGSVFYLENNGSRSIVIPSGPASTFSDYEQFMGNVPTTLMTTERACLPIDISVCSSPVVALQNGACGNANSLTVSDLSSITGLSKCLVGSGTALNVTPTSDPRYDNVSWNCISPDAATCSPAGSCDVSCLARLDKPPVVLAQCGYKAGNTYTDYAEFISSSGSLCHEGSATSPSAGSTNVSWQCNTSTDTRNCSAQLEPLPVCGLRDGNTFTDIAAFNASADPLCSNGSASTVVSSTAKASWSCTTTTRTTNCDANLVPVAALCGPKDGQDYLHMGSFYADSRPICDAGTPTGVAYNSSLARWTCQSPAGDMACEANLGVTPPPASCGGRENRIFDSMADFNADSASLCNPGNDANVTENNDVITWSCHPGVPFTVGQVYSNCTASIVRPYDPCDNPDPAVASLPGCTMCGPAHLTRGGVKFSDRPYPGLTCENGGQGASVAEYNYARRPWDVWLCEDPRSGYIEACYDFKDVTKYQESALSTTPPLPINYFVNGTPGVGKVPVECVPNIVKQNMVIAQDLNMLGSSLRLPRNKDNLMVYSNKLPGHSIETRYTYEHWKLGLVGFSDYTPTKTNSADIYQKHLDLYEKAGNRGVLNNATKFSIMKVTDSADPYMGGQFVALDKIVDDYISQIDPNKEQLIINLITDTVPHFENDTNLIIDNGGVLAGGHIHHGTYPSEAALAQKLKDNNVHLIVMVYAGLYKPHLASYYEGFINTYGINGTVTSYPHSYGQAAEFEFLDNLEQSLIDMQCSKFY